MKEKPLRAEPRNRASGTGGLLRLGHLAHTGLHHSCGCGRVWEARDGIPGASLYPVLLRKSPPSPTDATGGLGASPSVAGL